MNILDKIIARKKEEIAEARSRVSAGRLRELASEPREKRQFYERLKEPGPGGVNIIAEIKRASPSKGDIHPDLDPAEYAAVYEQGGAAAMSVLTDETFFKGCFEDYKTARKASGLPMIRKDFIISPYQIYESAVLQADAILLIVRILEPEQLREYLELAASLGLDVLVEAHSESEIKTATLAGAKLIGINNRNLGTFETDIETSARMISMFEQGQVAVAESGIHTKEDIDRLRKAGFFNFLIGESLVRAKDTKSFLKSLMCP